MHFFFISWRYSMQKTIKHIQDKLMRYKSLEYEIVYYQNKLNNLSRISFDQVKTTNHKDMKIKYIQRIDHIRNNMANIEKFIERCFNVKERVVLYMKYINVATLKEMSIRIYCGVTTIKRIETKALNAFIKKLQRGDQDE